MRAFTIDAENNITVFASFFRSIACVPECRRSGDARTCDVRHSCPYAKIFEPVADGLGPSGLADSPRPFVFRARHLDGHTIQPGQSFYFDLNVFSFEPDILAYLVLTFAALAREGLGPNRGKAELQSVRRGSCSLGWGASTRPDCRSVRTRWHEAAEFDAVCRPRSDRITRFWPVAGGFRLVVRVFGWD